MDEYEELASEVIDRVCDVVEAHYGVKPRSLTGDLIDSPALINGTVYHGLEDEIAAMLRGWACPNEHA